MPKVPGVTRDLLQKQILELLEELGIPAKEWVGKGGSKVKRLVTKTGISPFKRDLLGTLSQEKKTFGDALDVFQNEAKFIMNANDQELMNFKNNLTEYTSVGGKPRGPKDQGLGSMMKDLEASLKDLEKSAGDLKLSTEEAKAFSKEMMDDALETAKYGDPFKVPDKKSFGGSMYAEGNMRTALREFLQSEFKNGRLKLNKNDQFKVMNYSPMSEDDPILVYKRIYGDDAIKKVEDIVTVFEKGESFKHYEELLRQNVDDQFLKPVNQADVGDGRLVLDESVEIKEKLPDDDDIPFNQGGRVGLVKGSAKKLFNFTKKQLLDAVNDIFPTGDRKYDAEMVGDALVENNPKMFQNRLRQDLNDREYSEIYGTALDALDAFNREVKQLMQGNAAIVKHHEKEKGVGSLIKKVNEEFGEGTAKRASDLPKGTKYDELEAIKDFEARNPIEKSKGQIWKDEKGETEMIAMGGFSESEMAGLDKAFIKGKALSDAMKKMGYDTSSGKETLKFDEVVSQGMEGFPAEIKEEVIRAKYGDIVDQRLLDNLIGDTDPQHLSFVMGTIDEGLKMQEMGMGPDEILQSIKDSLKRQPQALGGGVGSMFRGV